MPLPYDTNALIKQTQAMLAQTKEQPGTAFAGSSYDTNRTGAVPVITPKSLTEGQTAITPVISSPTMAPDVTGLDAQTNAINAQYNALPNDSQISTLQQSIASLTGETSQSQEAARRAQLQSDPAFQAKQQQAQDLSAQLNALVSEAKGIQPFIKQQNLIDYSGRGIASGIVESKGSAEIRQKQLNNAIQSLSVASLLSASQGNLNLALDQVDRAIKAEFEPKRAELEAARANLDMYMNDPARTREEKRRAEIANATLSAQEKAYDTDLKNKETVQGMILQAQQNGAPTALLTQAIKDGTVFGAASILTGYTAKETAQSIQEYQFAKRNGYTGSFSDYQNEDANRKAVIAKAGAAASASGLSSTGLSKVLSVASQFDSEPVVKNYSVIQEGYNYATSLGNKANPTSTDDQALIYAFAKVMDPNSVVRESEYDTVQKYSQSAIQRGWADAKRMAQNVAFLTPEARKQMVETIKQKYTTSEQNYKNVRDEYARRINKVGGIEDGADYITDYAKTQDNLQDNMGSTPPVTQFADIQNKLTLDPTTKTAYIPREVWATLGSRMDALLKEAEADGYKLLIK